MEHIEITIRVTIPVTEEEAQAVRENDTGYEADYFDGSARIERAVAEGRFCILEGPNTARD